VHQCVLLGEACFHVGKMIGREGVNLLAGSLERSDDFVEDL